MEIIIRYTLIAILALSITSCKDKNQSLNKGLVISKNKKAEHPGKKLMETHCYVCHNPQTPHEERIAPPMIAVKTHYKTENITKEQFVNDIQNWIKHPTEEKSKMPGAIRNFGLMPYAYYPEKTISQIAEYMYEYDIDQPEWFADHMAKKRGNGKGMGQGRGMGKGKGKGRGMRHDQNSDQVDYADLGLSMALSTKAQLGKNLMGSIKEKGTVGAVAFCNERAYALTDSMANVHNAKIKRVSDKPRNQNNKANSKELGHIATFKEIVSSNEEVNPIVEEHTESVNFYYPIITNSMCLQCHGMPEEQVKPETLKTLTRLYPKDKATGYDVNQVRGIWSIRINK